MIKRTLPYIILIFILLPINFYSQKIGKDNFTFRVSDIEGDLNNDKKNDLIVVDMDIKDETRPLRIQIFLSHSDSKKLKLVISTTKLIESQYPKEKNGEHNGGNIPNFFIEKGVLQMMTDIKNRQSYYVFKYKNGNFELNTIERVIWDGKDTTTETKINLIKGTKLSYDQDYYKVSNKKIINIVVKPLPQIQHLTFSDLEAY